MNRCDWADCPEVPALGSAFCAFHADEYERVIWERGEEWWQQ